MRLFFDEGFGLCVEVSVQAVAEAKVVGREDDRIKTEVNIRRSDRTEDEDSGDRSAQ